MPTDEELATFTRMNQAAARGGKYKQFSSADLAVLTRGLQEHWNQYVDDPTGKYAEGAWVGTQLPVHVYQGQPSRPHVKEWERYFSVELEDRCDNEFAGDGSAGDRGIFNQVGGYVRRGIAVDKLPATAQAVYTDGIGRGWSVPAQ